MATNSPTPSQSHGRDDEHTSSCIAIKNAYKACFYGEIRWYSGAISFLTLMACSLRTSSLGVPRPPAGLKAGAAISLRKRYKQANTCVFSGLKTDLHNITAQHGANSFGAFRIYRCWIPSLTGFHTFSHIFIGCPRPIRIYKFSYLTHINAPNKRLSHQAPGLAFYRQIELA